MKKHLVRALAVLLVGFVIVAILVGRPAWHLARAAWSDGAVLPPVPQGFADDASRLNQVKVADTWDMPGGSAPSEAEAQLAAVLVRATRDGLKVAVAGAQHTMGGQTIYPDGVRINMLPWSKLELDEASNILHAQAGAVWKDVIPYLDARGKSVAVMQSNSAFSVGGSISANCHGWQCGRPPIDSTVERFRIMKADGTVVACSRTENSELFGLVLGGYGLFGVILDVDLRVVPNQRYSIKQQVVSAEELHSFLERAVRNDPPAQMIFARLNVAPTDFLGHAVATVFYAEDGPIPALTAAPVPALRRAIFRGSADSEYGKELRWDAESHWAPMFTAEHFSRNQLLFEDVTVFQNRSADSTDILHEYFVPQAASADFIHAMQAILPKHKVDLLNITVRQVNTDTETFLRYADKDMTAFVMLFQQPRTAEGEAAMVAATRALIDAALALEGRYYLPYRLHATPEQFHAAYPQARQFFNLKRKYDPGELFQNQFYRRYAPPRN